MSSYGIVPSDLDARLSPQRRIELTDSETAPTGSENTTITQAAIDRAESRLHNAAGEFYVIPIVARTDATSQESTALSATLKDIIVSLAAFDLMARKPEWLDRGQQSFYWSQLNKQNQALLQGLAAPTRDYKLPAAQEKAVFQTPTGGAKVISNIEVFTRDTMTEF